MTCGARWQSITLVLLTGLTACTEMRVGDHAAPRTQPPAGDEMRSAPEPESNRPIDLNANVQPGDATLTQPSCSCAEAVIKPKPKFKPKPKPEHREVAAAPPSEPVTPKTSTTALVNAQVRPTTESVTSILGKRVDNTRGEDLGRVVDVLADAEGRVRIAIIDFGGFLGVGTHRIGVQWSLLHFNPESPDSLVLSLSRDQLRLAPEYKDNPRPQILSEPTPGAPTGSAVPESKQ